MRREGASRDGGKVSRAVGSYDSQLLFGALPMPAPLSPPSPLGIFLVCPRILASTLRQGYLGAKDQRSGTLPRKEEANMGGWEELTARGGRRQRDRWTEKDREGCR